MNNDQVKGRRFKQIRGRIKASADSFFFGNPSAENKDMILDTVGKIQEGTDDTEKGPERDLEQEESYSNIRKDLQDDREDGR